MLAFFKANIGTIIVLIILAAAVIAVVAKMVKDKKNGKSVVCGGDCSKCHGSCSHKQ